MLNETDSSLILDLRPANARRRYFETTSLGGLVTVDQLMWRTIVHHIPRWREPCPLRDFMVRLWPFALWNVDCLHANRLIRCVWLAGSVVFMENNAHPKFRWDVEDDKCEWYSWCGGRWFGGVWETTFVRECILSYKACFDLRSVNFSWSAIHFWAMRKSAQISNMCHWFY